MFEFYEFFAGGGMARAGLGSGWNCLFANDFDHKKSTVYQRNWGSGQLRTCDVRSVTPESLPGHPNLVWASFPCQDLSLAGAGAGLRGDRSGTFWPFWEVIKGLISQGRAPEIIVLENVYGALTSHQGQDFSAICSAFMPTGYRFGAILVDASLFVPQSRQRLFIIGVRGDLDIPGWVRSSVPSPFWHKSALSRAFEGLRPEVQQKWVWWDMGLPPKRKNTFADLIEENPLSTNWHTPSETGQLMAMMSELNLAKVERAQASGRRMVGAIYKRTRHENGLKVQRAEVRFDDVAGCLRTPAGGSSRQLIVVVDGEKVRSRLISSRETARLMGLSDDYVLPNNYNEAYHLTGDGVAVPVVRHIAKNILEPILALQLSPEKAVV